MNNEKQKQLFTIISELLGKADVSLEHKLREDLGADSLDTVAIFMEIEEQFNVVIPDETAEKLKTVRDIVSFLEQCELGG